VPAEQRVRRDDRRDLVQRVTAKPVGSRGKLPSVVRRDSLPRGTRSRLADVHWASPRGPRV